MRVSVTIELNRPTLGRLRRHRLLAGVLIAALAVPSAVWASHQFTDVSTGHLFHNDIARAKDAGLTAGCSATTFCPETAVSRGQMTAFLSRGLGRVTGSYLSGNVVGSTPVVVGALTVRAGNPTGANQFVMLMASVHVKTQGVCPCEMFVGLYRNDGTPLGFDTFLDLGAVPSGQNYSDENATVLGIISIPTGLDQTFVVKVGRSTGSANVEVGGRFQAIVAPFDGLGAAAEN
jgi:hypothetical protein